MKKLLALLSACVALLTFSAGCAEEKYTSPYFFSMAADAAYILPSKITTERQNDCYSLYTETRELLNGIDGSLSATNENSYISKFNVAAAGSKTEVDKLTYDVLELALQIYVLTDGYYNPAVYYNVEAYGFGTSTDVPKDASELPSDEIIEKYNVLSASFGEIELSSENGRYYASKPETTVDIGGETCSMKIDLGGIGKGYAADAVSELMDKYNIGYGYFTFGESSIVFKSYIDNESGNYTLGLTNPRYVSGSSRQYMFIDAKNAGMSTSGDNVRYYEIDGVRYSHIIDPKTGKPVQTGIMSANVIGGSAAQDDAFTTALIAMGKEKAVEFINENLSDRKVVFTYNNNGKYEIITNIPEDEYTISEDSFTLASYVSDGKIVLL